jgi:nicotinic acid mononucleotide adenylyltransferase
MIRDTIKEGLNPSFLLPNPVIEYIKTNQLYKKINAN